ITNHDKDYQSYLQRIAGYCLTGSTREHAFFFFFGDGSNGKTTWTNVIMRIMGDYAQTAALELLTETRNEQHPTTVASLMAARLVVASEPKAGQHWDETKLKHLTGGDPLRARFMRCDEFSFWPQFK